MRELPYSNYPPGVDDDDPNFGEFNGRPESEAEYQSRKARNLPPEPDHDPSCQCEECELPF